MKKLFICFCLLTSVFAFAQDDVDVKGNTVSVKEKAPVWPGCEANPKKEECFNEKLIKLVKEHYKYPRNDKGEFIRGKVLIKMDIDKEGKAVIKSVKGDQKPVIAAVRKMLEEIPVMSPGTLAGKPTVISYKIPLNL
jgi:hypothetical protein